MNKIISKGVFHKNIVITKGLDNGIELNGVHIAHTTLTHLLAITENSNKSFFTIESCRGVRKYEKEIKLEFPICEECNKRHYKKSNTKCVYEGV